jgi:hypothetical protein
MPELALSIAAVTLTLVLATAGLALAGDRSKFPKRLQGGGSHGATDTEQVDRDE